MFIKGDEVMFIGCTKEQMNFGRCDDPRYILRVGSKYTVEDVDVHMWHTKIKLHGINGHFNSVCFTTDPLLF